MFAMVVETLSLPEGTKMDAALGIGGMRTGPCRNSAANRQSCVVWTVVVVMVGT